MTKIPAIRYILEMYTYLGEVDHTAAIWFWSSFRKYIHHEHEGNKYVFPCEYLVNSKILQTIYTYHIPTTLFKIFYHTSKAWVRTGFQRCLLSNFGHQISEVSFSGLTHVTVTSSTFQIPIYKHKYNMKVYKAWNTAAWLTSDTSDRKGYFSNTVSRP